MLLKNVIITTNRLKKWWRSWMLSFFKPTEFNAITHAIFTNKVTWHF